MTNQRCIVVGVPLCYEHIDVSFLIVVYLKFKIMMIMNMALLNSIQLLHVLADLTGHSNTQKHAKNAASASVTGANTGPISVQIVQTDPSPETRMRSPKKNDKDPMFGSSSSNNGRPQYTKRYRKEWEDIDELKGILYNHINSIIM